MTYVTCKQPRGIKKSAFNHIFDEFLQNGFNDFVGPKAFTTPRVNIVETNDAHLLEFAAPGFEKDDFNINVEGDQLTISAELKTEEEETEGKNYARKEFSFSNFKRTFTLPKTVDTEGINAKYKNGILHVTLPKKEEAKPAQRTVAIS